MLKPDWPQRFDILGYEVEEASGLVRLRYAFEGGPDLIEEIGFGRTLPARGTPEGAGMHAALGALAIAAGVSYYKAFVPVRLAVGHVRLEPLDRRFFQQLYVSGLGEFAYRNGIDIAGRVGFLAAADGGERASLPGVARLPRRSAVLVGGGKDSLVSIEILRAAGEPQVLLAVNPRKPIADCIAASGLPSISIARRLDPRLFELNDKGALNGHVPITGILSFIALAGAFVHGYDTVVLSNERSANEGNVVADGLDVNHQYSKSLAFEGDLRAYIAQRISRELAYVSLLRPLSEMHIARLMARTDRYDTSFTSCNASFRIRAGDPPRRWCRDCPKCRFTFLALANAAPRERLLAIFGGDLLDDPAQVAGYEELAGLSGHKPWECVGEIAESAAALLRLATLPAWSGSAVVRALAPRLRDKLPDFEPVWVELMTPAREHHLDPRLKGYLDAYLERR